MSTGWSTGCIALREAGFETIEATATAQDGWAQHMADCSSLTLHRLANTWYTGANVPGKALGVMPYTGGVGPYRSICDEVVSRGMLGFRLTGPDGRRAMQRRRDRPPATGCAPGAEHAGGHELAADRVDGAEGARAFVAQFNAGRPAGRPVGEVVDGTLPGADGAVAAIGSIVRRRRGRIRSWSISMAAAGCSATSNPTIRSAATCAGAPG